MNKNQIRKKYKDLRAKLCEPELKNLSDKIFQQALNL